MATIKEIKEELGKITELDSPLFKKFEKDREESGKIVCYKLDFRKYSTKWHF